MATFSMLTFNCFGVPTPTTRRRLLTLARELNHSDYGAVCLQEVQAHMYRKLLTHATVEYSDCVYTPFVHAPKGGLLTLVRMPIKRKQFILYRDRGLWHTPAVADWILHKGVLLTQMEFEGVPVAILNTHLTANYRGEWDSNNKYVQQERGQLEQLAEIVHEQDPATLVIVAGDFNIPRGSKLYEDFLAASGLIDPLYGNHEPTYRPLPGIAARFAMPIDFALYRAPRLRNLKVQSMLCFRDKVSLIGRGTSYLSDHCGIELCLTWEREPIYEPLPRP